MKFFEPFERKFKRLRINRISAFALPNSDRTFCYTCQKTGIWIILIRHKNFVTSCKFLLALILPPPFFLLSPSFDPQRWTVVFSIQLANFSSGMSIKTFKFINNKGWRGRGEVFKIMNEHIDTKAPPPLSSSLPPFRPQIFQKKS